ncbi:MAG: patatin-like phospholipase family protein [Bacteroidota bacterium]
MNNSSFSHHELKLQQLRKILPKIFGDMNDQVFDSLLPYFEWKELHGNRFLFHQGDVGNKLFILISGRLQVVMRRKDGSSEILGEVTRGETVGEMAIFTGETRSADIIAVRDSVLVSISRYAFEEIIAKHPTVVMNITRLIIERLKERNSIKQKNAFKTGNIVLLPLGRRVAMKDFTELLVRKLDKYGDILHLSSDKVNQLLNVSEVSQSNPQSNTYHRVSGWLDEQEARNDYLIYQADYGPTEWTKRCLRQADEILLIAHHQDSPVPDAMEKDLLEGFDKITSAQKILVLLRESASDEITGTAEWLQNRSVKTHHHLVEGSVKDMSRLVRFLTGNALGLVLSGGGAKGMAHIGVHMALEEYGIPIDMVGGTSIGSLMGGFMAMGLSAKEIFELNRVIFLDNPTPISDYNLIPFVSLLKAKKLEKHLVRLFGERKIEDLNPNYFCISSNLSNVTSDVHKNGLLRRAIRASISLPGIFPPVVYKNGLHVDGGIFNNLPIDVMEQMGAGFTMAVDLDIPNDDEVKLDCIPSTWQIIKGKLFGKTPFQIPSLMSILVKSTTLNSDFKTRQLRTRADLYFNPDLSHYGLIDWKTFDQCVQAGYENAIHVLENWQGGQ